LEYNFTELDVDLYNETVALFLCVRSEQLFQLF